MLTLPTNKTHYQGFRQLNKTPINTLARSRTAITSAIAKHYFSGDSLQDRLVREFSEQQLLPIKEILESFEFFTRVRKYVRAPLIADLCCGHGLIGILFALFERSVEQVTLIDHKVPPSFPKVLASANRVGPWVADKIHYKTISMKSTVAPLDPSTSIVAAHACGTLTDRCLDSALRAHGAVALMPCCYPDRACPAPAAIQLNIGTELAFDIDRTYRLQTAGYRIRWDSIPAEITPMNRILIGIPPAPVVHTTQTDF